MYYKTKANELEMNEQQMKLFLYIQIHVLLHLTHSSLSAKGVLFIRTWIYQRQQSYACFLKMEFLISTA